MTGSPSYTFRDRNENPSCGDCGEEMIFLERQDGTFNEKDLYGCRDCKTTFEDCWRF